MIREPFTQMDPLPQEVKFGGPDFIGTTPYFAMPSPQLPAQRSADLPPVVSPERGPWGWRKSGLPPQASPAWFAGGPGGLVYGPGSGPGQGVIQSAQPIKSVTNVPMG